MWAATRRLSAGRNPEPRSEELAPFTPAEIDALEIELGPVYGPLVVFAAETGLRTNEWAATERRDIDRFGTRRGGCSAATPTESLTPLPKDRPAAAGTVDRARVARARPAAAKAGDTAVAPRSRGGHINLHSWRLREWYPAPDAAGLYAGAAPTSCATRSPARRWRQGCRSSSWRA